MRLDKLSATVLRYVHMKISEFPDGQDLWVVKWVDGYRAAHLATVTTSVMVLLQRVEQHTTMDEISWMSKEDVSHVLGKPPNYAKALLEANAKDETLYVAYVHVGLIPLLRTGLVFQNQALVGQLPTHNCGLILNLRAGIDDIQEVAVGQSMPKPSTWTAPTYLALNDFELRHAARKCSKSRCLVIHHDNTDVYLPRQVIFQWFYAPHSELAKAFTNGPWKSTRHSIVHTKPLASGLQTGIRTDTGAYQVILETRVPDRFARLVAMLFFDETASRCSELIYTNALRDRKESNSSTWYASAELPYRYGAALTLHVKGYFLRSWNSSSVRQKYLVSQIAGATPPTYLPEIFWERVNSGLAGKIREVVDAQAPYYQNPSRNNEESQPANHPGEDTKLTSDQDASTTFQPKQFDTDSFEWINAPELLKLVKNSSKIYTGGFEQPPPETNLVSTGNLSGSSDAATRLDISSVVREPVRRFEHLLQTMESLKNDQKIESFHIIQPSLQNQVAQRGSLMCWSLLHNDHRRSGNWPKRGWRILSPVRVHGVLVRGIPRTALLAEIFYKSRFIYWIEIECRETEGGYLSPIIFSEKRLSSSNFINLLEVIAANEGKNLRSVLTSVVRVELGAHMNVYKHNFDHGKGGVLDVKSVIRAFERGVKNLVGSTVN